MEKQYRPKEVAVILGLSDETVRRKLRAGLIKSVKYGRSYRISETNLQRYIEKGE